MPSITISDTLWEQLVTQADTHNITPQMLAEEILRAAVREPNPTDLSDVLAGISAGVLVQGTRAEILMGNQAALEMLGLTWDQLMGRTSFDPEWHVIHEDGSLFPGPMHPVPQAIATGKPVHDVIMGVFRPRHDDRVWLRVSAVPQFDAEDKLKQVICTFTEVSAQKQAEAQLERANAVLERRVAQRTQALAEANQKLRQSETQLRLITENVRDLFILHDLDGDYLYISPSCEAMLGYTQAELLEKNPYDLFHPEDIERVRLQHQRILDSNANSIVTYRYRSKSGEYVWLETKTTAVFDEGGTLTNLVTTSRDVTRRIRIEESLLAERNLLHTIMEASPAGITVVDKGGSIIFANARAQAILGIKRSELVERTYDAPAWQATDYDGNPWPDERQPFVQVMTTRQPVWDVRHAIVDETGRRVYLVINGVPIFDDEGEIEKAVFTVEDYTRRKQQDDELQAALKHQQELNQLKTRFITMVSHEFRTPMAIIMTSTAILRRKAATLTPDDLLSRLERIERQVERLDRMVGDATFINRTERTVEPRPVTLHIHRFLQQLIADTQVIAEQHRITLHVTTTQPDDELFQDEALLYQICTNLLSNAIKYSRPDGKVYITQTRQEGAIVLTIRDEGIGVPAEAQDKVFTPFYRAENAENIAGTGLGLAIVRRAVDAIGGTITFTSRPKEGTTFTVRIPLVYQPAQAQADLSSIS